MTELYSIRDVSKLFGLGESRLRYWIQTGLVTPSVRRGGRLFYTFPDLVNVKAATELLGAGVTVQRVRAQLAALRSELPGADHQLSRLRVCSDGRTLVVVGDDAAYEPSTGQVVMAFAVSSLDSQIADVLDLPGAAAPAADDEPASDTAYRRFTEGVAAEDRGEPDAAERAYRDAVALEPGLAAAHANLGALLYRGGDSGGARRSFDRALDLDPELPEARFNLANLLADTGDTELAISELRRVSTGRPGFADAHYNLAVLLARVGGFSQARGHIDRYLSLGPEDAWARRARAFRDALPARQAV